MKLTEAEIAEVRLSVKIASYRIGQRARSTANFDRLPAERKADKATIERWGILIDGALANTYGPYSDKELLRRVTELLSHATR